MARHPEDWQSITMAVATADHRIGPDDAFHRTLETCLATAERTGGLVTIGIRPDRPETGFGYIEIGQPDGATHHVLRFREKPDLATAKAFLAAGRFLWNSGMFFWTLGAFVGQLDAVAPDLSDAICTIAGALSAGKNDEAETLFESLRNVSIDVALMERADNVYVVEAEFDWDDLGSWDAMSRSYEPDADGNVFFGESEMVYTRDSVIYNESTAQEVCVLGMEEVVVVVTDGKILVCPKDRAQEVRRFAQRG
jgi:mannose-1-phosphate guanylyltransferase